MDSYCLSMDGAFSQACRRDREPDCRYVVSARNLEIVLVAVAERQSPAHIRQTYAVAPGVIDGFTKGAGVGDFDSDLFVMPLDTDLNKPGRLPWRDAMLNRVFHQWLNRKHRHLSLQRLGIHLYLRSEFRAEPQLLDLEVSAHDDQL